MLTLLLERPLVRRWAWRCYNGGPLGWNHGTDLQKALWQLGGHREAEVILRHWVDEKWIEPVAYCPTPEQRFFNTGAALPVKRWPEVTWPDENVFKRPAKLMLVSPIEFRFKPNPENAAFVAYARDYAV